MIKTFNCRQSPRRDKPWFDFDCRTAKQNFKKSLKNFKLSNFAVEYKNDFIISKRNYQNLLSFKKKNHEIDIQNKFADTKNSKEFWSVYSNFKNKNKPFVPNPIPLGSWENFFDGVYPNRATRSVTFTGPYDPELDRPITYEELDDALKSMAPGKAPGLDQINASFFKNLSPLWLSFLLNFFNIILSSESLPDAWSKAAMILFHKKGDTNDPLNYRGIALINTIAKIFTKILCSRLVKWTIAHNILSETQNGFRAGRSCSDNVFVLQSAIHCHLRLKKGNIYALFVDLRRAFDTVSHELLWQKLFDLGVSTKFIRVLIQLYKNASFVLKLNDEISKDFNVTEGVLQGENLSPLLFILFINDFETFLRSKHLCGVNIDGNTDLLSLLYADDAVILADSPSNMRKILSAVEEYAFINNLVVNTKKTKIVHFRSGGRQTQQRFLYKGENIEVVSSYEYLGVPFSSSSLGLTAAKHFVNKAKMAIGASQKLFTSCKADSLQSRMVIFDSAVRSVLLYSASFWSLRYLGLIETVQLDFLKKTFALPACCPGTSLRLELGVLKIAYNVFTSAWKSIVKFLQMDDSRLPRICLLRLVRLHLAGTCDPRYNWVTQFDILLDKINFSHLWYDMDYNTWSQNQDHAFEKFALYLRNEDLVGYYVSNAQCCKIIRTLNDTQPLYLTERNSHAFVKTFIQFRLASQYNIRFTDKNILYKLNPATNCSICNLQKPETLHHFVIECPMYAELRSHYLGTIVTDLCNLAYCTDSTFVKKIHMFIIQAFRIRAFILNE